MKKLILTLVTLAACLQITSAQTCSQFINTLNGKKLTYANLNTEGKSQGKLVYGTVKKNESTVTLHGEVFDKIGKSIGTGDSEMICTGQSIKVDMKAFIPTTAMKQFSNMQMTGDAKYLSYPVNLKAGQKLDDGTVTINISNGGQQMGNLQVSIVNRNVLQAEKVTTKAGSFDCFKINYVMKVKATMMGMALPFDLTATEWYSPKLGRFVKSETYKNDKPASSMVLESIN
jgi:hypothetical protein